DTTLGGAEAQIRFEVASKQSNDPPLSRVNTLRSGDDSMKLKELMDLCTKLPEKNTAIARTLDTEEMEITATIDGKVKIVSKASIRRHHKLEDSDGISNLSTTEIFKQLAFMGTYIAPTFTQKLFNNMRRASKGYTEVDIPLFPTMLCADNRPPMLEKDMYDSWKSIMELYTMNRQHGRMILESFENGPLIWPSIEENGVTKPKKYSELSAMEAIQADYDIKATNIILQGLPPEVYALVRNHKVAKELWARIQLLMQGTSLTRK
ncbi:hypothetical protein Tco_0507820, partial [Tanacetum coccineum]